jgi:hypothetical protein
MSDDDNTAVKVARGLNAVSRATGLPYNKGAVAVQQNADQVAGEKILREVPRNKAPLYDHPSSQALRDSEKDK